MLAGVIGVVRVSSEYGRGVQAYGTGVVKGWGALMGPMVLVFDGGLASFFLEEVESPEVHRRIWLMVVLFEGDALMGGEGRKEGEVFE